MTNKTAYWQIKQDDDKVAVADNINKTKFVGYIISHVFNN